MTYRCLLKDKMDRLGMSQRELARMTGYTNATISLLMTGKRYGNIETWLTISRVLGCTVDDLFVKSDKLRYKEV